MRVEMTYYADDGKEFDSREECLEYERQIKADFGSMMFFDGNLVWNKTADIPFIESEMMCFKVLDEVAANRLFRWLYTACGVCMPDSPVKQGHIYRYDERDGWADNYWLDVTERYEDLAKIIQKVESAE